MPDLHLPTANTFIIMDLCTLMAHHIVLHLYASWEPHQALTQGGGGVVATSQVAA